MIQLSSSVFNEPLSDNQFKPPIIAYLSALIRAFEDTFEGEQVSEFKLTHFTLDIERSFYIWLYEEFN